jgi:hypothetical protein
MGDSDLNNRSFFPRSCACDISVAQVAFGFSCFDAMSRYLHVIVPAGDAKCVSDVCSVASDLTLLFAAQIITTNIMV